jgi:hypothetical protein
MRQANNLRAEGMPINKVAQLVGYHHTQMARYLRLWARYGPEAFIAQTTLDSYPTNR